MTGGRVLAALLLVATATAAFCDDYAPTRFGVGVSAGNSYSPDTGVGWFQATGAMIVDYDRVAWHRAPQPLRLKVEASAGVATAPEPRATAAVNMLALYYLAEQTRHWLTPYVEAGIGVIYTDFRREDQGLRFNFNPVASIGFEVGGEQGRREGFIALRFHHVSNGGLHGENTGINSLLLQAGILF